MAFFSQDIKRYAILEVESGSVATLVYELPEKKDTPVLVFEKRIFVDIKKGIALSTIITELPGVLRRLSDALAQFGRFERVDVCICAPWSYVAHIQAEKNEVNPFLITPALEKEALSSAKTIDPTLEKTIQDLVGPYAKEAVIHTTKMSRVFLNGYPTKEYLGKSAREFKALVTQHVSIKSVRTKIEEITDPMSVRRTLLTDHMSVAPNLSPERTVFTIDVGSYVTELALVRHGRIDRYAIIPFGIESFIRAFAETKNMSRAEADSHLAVIESHIEAGSTMAGSEFEEVKEYLASWQSSVREFVYQCSKELYAIDDILCIAGAHTKFFSALIESDSFMAPQLSKAKRIGEDVGFHFQNGIPKDNRLRILSAFFVRKES